MAYRRYRLQRPSLDKRLDTLDEAVFAEINRRRDNRVRIRNTLTLQLFSIVSAFAAGLFYSQVSALSSMWSW